MSEDILNEIRLFIVSSKTNFEESLQWFTQIIIKSSIIFMNSENSKILIHTVSVVSELHFQNLVFPARGKLHMENCTWKGRTNTINLKYLEQHRVKTLNSLIDFLLYIQDNFTCIIKRQ